MNITYLPTLFDQKRKRKNRIYQFSKIKLLNILFEVVNKNYANNLN